MTYRQGKVSDDKVKTKFTLYSETETIAIEHKKYVGTSDYELIKAIKEVWNLIDDNEILPDDKANPDRTPSRTRDQGKSIIGVYFKPLPTDPTRRQEEVEAREAHEHQLRKVAFRAARNILDDEKALEAFGDSMEEEQEAWDEEEVDREADAYPDLLDP